MHETSLRLLQRKIWQWPAKHCGTIQDSEILFPIQSELKPTSSDLSSLSAFPYFNSEAIEGMKSELPTYLAAVAQQFDPCEWWKYHSADIPMWARSFRKIARIHPSSAAAERVFSLLQSSFGKQQEQSLEDYIQHLWWCSTIIEMIISVDNHYNKVENNLGIMGYH